MLKRYLPAFITAIKMTLRGERPQARYPALLDWAREAARQVEAIRAAADAGGISQSVRETLYVRLDGREVSVETVLAGLRHHFAQEYPYLLRHDIAHNLAAIVASNLNDQYRLARLAETEALQSGPVLAAIGALRAHLDALPPLEEVEPVVRNS